jgi:signal transduction histidine kinase
MAKPSPRRLSITIKLALLIGALLVTVTTVFGVAAYETLSARAAAAVKRRLGTVVDLLAVTLNASRNQLLAGARSVADTPAVSRFTVASDARARLAAQAAMQPRGPGSEQMVAVELWSTDGRLLLAVGDARRWADSASALALLHAAAATDSGVVGPFRAVGDTIVYGIAAPVVVAGRARGYLQQWRVVASTAATRAQNEVLKGIIGSDARFFVGSSAGDVWTDLVKPVPGPPVDVVRAGGMAGYQREDVGQVLGAARVVPGAPWVILVEFPRNAIIAPARDLLRLVSLVGALVLVAGLAGAWALSLSISRPIAGLTRAAEAIAAGDYSQPVARLRREDELGRLAHAFDVMVASVRESQRGLEERVRARTAELEDRNAELEAFAYSISHDLRAPLRAMQGFSLALLEDYGDRLDEAGRRYAERVITAARTMDRLIDDLLAYSRLARAELRLVPLDLGRLVRSSLDQLDGEVRGRQARITVAEPLPTVVGHGTTLAQVFANLVANAVKFVPAGRVPEVIIRAEQHGGRVRVWVEDNGIGIAAEHHERIFRVFERLHRAEDYPGTGIGLAIVRKGVERMGGAVGLESALGSGSKFWIELPRAS